MSTAAAKVKRTYKAWAILRRGRIITSGDADNLPLLWARHAHAQYCAEFDDDKVVKLKVTIEAQP